MKTNLSLAASNRSVIQRKAAAFSLVEVVLAVGIMAVGVVTILGLLPHGMEMSRKTANEQAETRIVDQLIGELNATDWTTMSGLVSAGNAGITRFFDDQGLEITGSAGSIQELLNYVARVSFVDSAEAAKGMPMPSKSGRAINPNLRRVQIEVAPVPDPQFNFESPPPGIKVRTFTQLVAKIRK